MAVSTDASYIYVNGGTYTLDGVYVAEGGTYIVRTGSDPYQYTIQGNRCLRIYGGATVNISNAFDTLTWTGVTSSKTILEVGSIANSTTGTLTAVGGVTIDANSGTSYNSMGYIYGSSSFQGEDGNEVNIVGFYSFRITDRSFGSASDWDYVILKDPDYVASNSYLFQYTNDRDCIHPHTFDHVTLSNVADTNYAMYLPGNCDMSNCTFNYFNIDNFLYGPYFEGAIVKFTNSTWSHISQHTQLKGSGARGFLYRSTFSSDTRGKNIFNQPKITFESCTFQDNYDSSANEMCFGFYDMDSIVKFKNCTFAGVDDASTYGVAAYYHSRYLYEGTTTFTNVTNNRYWATLSYGAHYDVFSLNMTVYSSDGSSISNAMVDVDHSEGYERWTFVTNNDGQVKDVFSDDPVFVYREILDNTPTYDYWSDSISDGRYHTIRVYKDGYQPWEKKVEFSQNRTIDVYLFPLQSVRSLSQG